MIYIHSIIRINDMSRIYNPICSTSYFSKTMNLKKELQYIFCFLLLAFMLVNCGQTNSSQSGDDIPDGYITKMSWYDVECLDSENKVYGISQKTEDRYKILEKEGEKYFWGKGYGIRKINGIDTIVDESRLIYKFRLSSGRSIEAEVVEKRAENRLIYSWISTSSPANDGYLEVGYLTSTEEYRKALTGEKTLPKELLNKMLLPVVYHDKKYWIDALFKHKVIEFSEDVIRMNGENYYHSGNILEVIPGYWLVSLDGLEKPLKIKKVDDKGTSFYELSVPGKDSYKLPHNANRFILHEPILLNNLKYANSRLNDNVLGGLNVCTPIYELPYMTVSEGYLREANHKANIIESVEEYLKFKHGISLSKNRPIYNIKGNAFVAQKEDAKVQFLIFKKDGTDEDINSYEDTDYLFIAVVNFEGVLHVVYEGTISVPFFAKIINFSMFGKGERNLIDFNRSDQSKYYIDNSVESIRKSTGGFKLTLQTYRENYEDDTREALVPDSKIQLEYDWVFDADYVKHTRSDDNYHLGYTWVLSQLLKNGSPVSLDKLGVIDIRNDDHIYPIYYVGQ